MSSDKEKIVLASASPRRKTMFEEMGIEFEVIPADIDECQMPGEFPRDFAVRTAGEKGLAVATQLANQGRFPWIVAADTIVVLDDLVLTKPVDDEDGKRMLQRLAGKKHRVITGWAVGSYQGDWTASFAETDVLFHPLTEAQIDGYIATGEGRDKAGSYAIQNVGAFLVDRIDGNYFNVVGLPISHVVRELIAQGALPGFLLS